VHDDRSNGDLLGCADHAHERIVKKGRADSLALSAYIDSQARKDRNREGLHSPRWDSGVALW
jgi:hypothetical protein